MASTIGTPLLGQPPNEDVCTAQILTPDGSCVTGTTIDATPDLDDPGCTDSNGAYLVRSDHIS